MQDRNASPPPYDVVAPVRQTAAVMFASPHSGRHYPGDLMAATDLSELDLCRSADNFVDDLFAAAPEKGAPLLRAAYARAYLDLNREPWELDPQMFTSGLPSHVNSTSLRVAGGLGTIPRLAADGREIYRNPLDFDEVRDRLNRIYFPYHHCLSRMLEETQRVFGHCLLIDCHSMPSTGGGLPGRSGGEQRADIVLGDRFGTACAPEETNCAHHILSGPGLRVQRNNPYAGGFTTYHYGRPAAGVHALQIEINRRLYMDEEEVRPVPGIHQVKDAMTALIGALCDLPASAFASREAAE